MGVLEGALQPHDEWVVDAREQPPLALDRLDHARRDEMALVQRLQREGLASVIGDERDGAKLTDAETGDAM